MYWQIRARPLENSLQAQFYTQLVTSLSLPSIGNLTLDITNFLTANPFLARQVGGHALSHMLYSYIRRSARSAGLSRRQARKMSNRKRRWFVDNIVMHHKRLHDRNREMIVSNARSRIIAKREAMKKKAAALKDQPQKDRDEKMKWRSSADVKNRGQTIRERIDNRKLRARSRWQAVTETILITNQSSNADF